jgi:hypothetical protein
VTFARRDPLPAWDDIIERPSSWLSDLTGGDW